MPPESVKSPNSSQSGQKGITTSVAGRLGNQMFQYAYPRIRAEELGLPFRLVVPEVSKRFDGIIESSGEADSYAVIPGGPFYHAQKECIESLVRHREDVRGWFPMTSYGREFLDDVGDPPVVNFRGKEFLSPGWRWNLREEYYHRAMKKLTGKPIVITDDPRYAKKIFKDCETFNSEDDMSILAHARELVCSYSTYCWWGAFLGDHDVVVVPDQGFLFKESSRLMGWTTSPAAPAIGAVSSIIVNREVR